MKHTFTVLLKGILGVYLQLIGATELILGTNMPHVVLVIQLQPT